jgi:hypothetical protein
MDFEQQLQQVAQRYIQEGYVVVVHPKGDQLPPFARSIAADLTATRGEERVLVQVKTDRAALEADPNVPAQAEITNAQPGWRYDLVILNEDDPLRRLTRDAREPSDDEIKGYLGQAEKLLDAGDLRAACMLAWSALEAAMRRIASDVELYMPRKTSSELLRTLYGNGILSREDFDMLNRGYRLRTEIVHGLVPPSIDSALIAAAIRATRSLLAGDQKAKNIAG